MLGFPRQGLLNRLGGQGYQLFAEQGVEAQAVDFEFVLFIRFRIGLSQVEVKCLLVVTPDEHARHSIIFFADQGVDLFDRGERLFVYRFIEDFKLDRVLSDVPVDRVLAEHLGQVIFQQLVLEDHDVRGVEVEQYSEAAFRVEVA